MAVSAVVAVVAIVGALVAKNQSEKSREAQRRANRKSERAAALRNTNARRKAVRRAIIAQSQARARAEIQGVDVGASRVTAGISAEQTQLGAAEGLQQNLVNINTARLKDLNRAEDFMARARDVQALTNSTTSAVSSFA